MGDLVIGAIDGGAKTPLEPAIEPAVSRADGGVDGSLRHPTGGLEAHARNSRQRKQRAAGDRADARHAGPLAGNRHVSAQFNTAALPPGRYLARGTIRQDGKPQGHMIRPFRIVAAAAAATARAPVARP